MIDDSPLGSETVSGEWELRASGGRSVLSGGDPGGDPGANGRYPDAGAATPIPAELHTSLDEWARVAATLSSQDDAAGVLVTDRGRWLALRVADSTGTPVRYIDPVHGGAELIRPTPVREPVPWATGLPVSLMAATVMVVALAALSEGLASVGLWLAIVGNIVIAGGLAPSLWLLRDLPTWRWVGYGATAGIVAAWIAMLVALPS